MSDLYGMLDRAQYAGDDGPTGGELPAKQALSAMWCKAAPCAISRPSADQLSSIAQKSEDQIPVTAIVGLSMPALAARRA